MKPTLRLNHLIEHEFETITDNTTNREEGSWTTSDDTVDLCQVGIDHAFRQAQRYLHRATSSNAGGSEDHYSYDLLSWVAKDNCSLRRTFMYNTAVSLLSETQHFTEAEDAGSLLRLQTSLQELQSSLSRVQALAIQADLNLGKPRILYTRRALVTNCAWNTKQS